MMESPGKFLREERETRNISLEEISNFTKIKERHLKAIEEDRYELLPPALYVKGFLKGYARYLTLDPKDIVLQYENYLKSLIPPEPIELPQQALPHKKSVRPWFLFSLIFAVILLTVLFISYPARRPIEEKPKAISLPPSLPSPAIQQEVRVQRIYPAQQNEFPGSEKLEVKNVATQQSPVLEVLEASIGTGIERDGVQQFLTGKCSDFTSNNQRGYFFTRIKTPRTGKISHIWLWEGKEYYRMEIDVKPPAWSVYSYYTFRPQHIGNWKAEARDGDHILTSLNFRVTQSSGDRSL
ncbi:MAG: hypothetical protein COZ69_05925 [Deltaproteobacteria bacterium CG_4_8_14_3_um_filter_45_9]|nr:MAG: hypothetical protein COS40_13610 [Deltaproteobacteria bacterium CG03_land_8_20_14_0_80_45_14]PIX24514.1 MAG: hypothetical protein COZ69_05925 [Deltaproteobacteria bacterium CG_4_8_14_3_um_filter_45_9]